MGESSSEISSVAMRWQEEPWSVMAFCHNIWSWSKNLFSRHPVLATAGLVVLVAVLYALRSLYQPYALLLRIYSGGVIAAVLVLLLWWLAFRRTSVRVKTFGSAVLVLVIGALILLASPIHEYVASYFRYRTLELVDLSALPTTDHERVIPLNGVYTLAKQRMNETEMVAPPHLVRVGERYEWTMAVEPARVIQQLFSPIEEIINLPSTDASPDLSRRNAVKVNFDVGESLLLSRQTMTCTRRAFGPSRFLNYEPSTVLYMKDDNGAWVQVVTLIKWSGIFFPWPEFGGVQVIPQGNTTVLGRVFLGCGTWVPPQEVHKHAFLRGQNTVPYEVTRFMAASLRFQAGFLAPLPGSRIGDIRIADLPDDVNQQPFTTYLKMPTQVSQAGTNKLYHAFALEPSDEDKRGLATSFFAPADGIGPVYAYRHFARNEAPLGVSAVSVQVEASRRTYDWARNRPVEHRFYIRDIADEAGEVRRRLFWLTTVVTLEKKKEGGPAEFTSGSTPEIALTEAGRSVVVWVNPHRSDTWPDELHKALGHMWTDKP